MSRIMDNINACFDDYCRNKGANVNITADSLGISTNTLHLHRSGKSKGCRLDDHMVEVLRTMGYRLALINIHTGREYGRR